MMGAAERKWVANGQEIARARRHKGISQELFAQQIGITRRHMIRLENGENLPSGGLRDRMADVLDVDRDEIRSADDDDDEESALHIASTEDLLGELLSRLPQPVSV
jgi:transcriptional regulator with XRE-family HTH domain